MRPPPARLEGLDVVLSAAYWGRWQVLRQLDQAGADLSHRWGCPDTLGEVNLVGFVLSSYHDHTENGLMTMDLHRDFLQTLGAAVEAAGPVAVVPAPAPLALVLVDKLREVAGVEVVFVGW